MKTSEILMTVGLVVMLLSILVYAGLLAHQQMTAVAPLTQVENLDNL